jgi:hypothetical protein
MIESEQNKRKHVTILTPSAPVHQTPPPSQPSLIEPIEIQETGDLLTENLLSQIDNKEDWKQYDVIMQKQIEDATRQAGQSIGKQRILNELKFIDEKMKLMNQMADHMDSDYKKYDQILDTVQDLRKKHEIIVTNPTKPTKKVELEDEKPIFYKKKQADEQIKRLKVKKIINNNLNLSDLNQEEEQRVNELLNNNTESSIKLDNSFYSY